MRKIQLFLIFIFCTTFTVNFAFSQISTDKFILAGKKQLAEATDNWNEANIIKARSIFERLLAQKKEESLAHYYTGLADYRLASRYFISQDARAGQYLDDGIKNLEQAIKKNKKFADAHALLATLYGQKISLNPSLAMSLGQQSFVSFENAKRLQPNNPRVLLLQATSVYYTPEQFGGSKIKAMRQMQVAIEQFGKEKGTDPLLPDWGYEDALMMMATWQMESGDHAAALKFVNKTLQINPDFGWAKAVKDSLAKELKKEN